MHINYVTLKSNCVNHKDWWRSHTVLQYSRVFWMPVSVHKVAMRCAIWGRSCIFSLNCNTYFMQCVCDILKSSHLSVCCAKCRCRCSVSVMSALNCLSVLCWMYTGYPRSSNNFFRNFFMASSAEGGAKNNILRMLTSNWSSLPRSKSSCELVRFEAIFIVNTGLQLACTGKKPIGTKQLTVDHSKWAYPQQHNAVHPRGIHPFYSGALCAHPQRQSKALHAASDVKSSQFKMKHARVHMGQYSSLRSNNIKSTHKH